MDFFFIDRSMEYIYRFYGPENLGFYNSSNKYFGKQGKQRSYNTVAEWVYTRERSF